MRKIDDLTDREIDRIERLPAPTLAPSPLGEALFAGRLEAWKRKAGQDPDVPATPATLRTLGEAAEDDALAQFERAERFRRWLLAAGVVGAAQVLARVGRWAWSRSPAIRLDQRVANWRSGRGFVRNDEVST